MLDSERDNVIVVLEISDLAESSVLSLLKYNFRYNSLKAFIIEKKEIKENQIVKNRLSWVRMNFQFYNHIQVK